MITLAVSVSAVFSLSPLVRLDAPASVTAPTLYTPFAYDLIAPLSNVLDALTLLTPPQYWATFGLCALAFLLFCWSSGSRIVCRASVQRLAKSTVLFTAGAVALIGVMLVVRRPMASLRLQDRDLIAVDFHSHTSSSHDGRPGFDSEKNREWHRSAGFNAAYITDHRTFAGALQGSEFNPATAGAGVVLLSGIELHDRGEHPLLLGADAHLTNITSPDWQGTIVVPAAGSVPPVLVLSMPGNIEQVPANEYKGTIRLAGIEESDGSPRGMGQAERDRAGIANLSETLYLTPVSGSDNHGWGRAAPAWTVLRIQGWQSMSPSTLDAAIRRVLLAHEPGFSEVIARRTAISGTGRVEQALAGISVVVMMFRTMNVRERFSWLVWSWLSGIAAMVRARQNRRQLRLLVRRNYVQRARRPAIDAAAAMEVAS